MNVTLQTSMFTWERRNGDRVAPLVLRDMRGAPTGSKSRVLVTWSLSALITSSKHVPPQYRLCPDLSILLIQGEAPVILRPKVPAIVLFLLYGMLVLTPHPHLTPTMWSYLWNGPAWEEGHWQTRLSQYSHPFPLTVHLLVLRLVLGYLYCLTPINISWRIFPLRSWICCNLSLTLFRVPPKVKSRTQQEFVKQPFDVCVNILCYFLLYYLVNTIL